MTIISLWFGEDYPIEVLDWIVPCDRHVFRYVIDAP
jgi:hypothetical protein